MSSYDLGVNNPLLETGEYRASRAIRWCEEELRTYGRLHSLREKISLLLLYNATHILDRRDGKTTDSFPSFVLENTEFPNHENLHNFLMAEQIWLENNSREVVNYGINLLTSRLNMNENQTSDGLRQVIYQILKDLKLNEKSNFSILDPACGFGFLLSELTGLFPNTKLRLAGQEINEGLSKYTKQLFRLVNHDIDVRQADLLSTDAFANEKFDLVLLDAPLAMAWDSSRVSQNDDRFRFGLPSNRDANLLFIQAGLSKLKSPAEGGGVLIAVTTNRNLIAERENKLILESFADKDLMQAVISLPGGVGRGGSSIPTYLLIMTNLKSSNWVNKIQLIDVKANFEDAYGSNGRKRLLTKDAISQISLAISKPKPLKSVRTISKSELWLQRTEISYPDVQNNIWNKTGAEKAAKFTLNTLLLESPFNDFDRSKNQIGLTKIEIKDLGKYLSFEVEPRFKSNSNKASMLGRKVKDTLALIEFTREIATFSKSNIGDFDSSKSEYLAIPRDTSEKCFHVYLGDSPENIHKYIFLSLIQEERIPYLVAWLNSGFGTAARWEVWEQLKDESRFMLGMFHPSEILQFCAFLHVPLLDSKKMKQISTSVTQVEQNINILKSLQDELWVDTNAIETIAELSKSINGEVSLSKWVNDLPFPLAASLRTYESFSLDSSKASDQLIHFWEATATFMATYLLSSLRKSEDLWKSEVPKLNTAIEAGHCSLDRATIGTWRITLEYLTKRFNSWLVSNDVDEQNRAIQLLGGGSRRIYERLLNPQVVNLLTQVNEFRNKYDGHSGTTTKIQEERKHDELLAITNDLRALIGNAWQGLRLIRPIVQYNLREGIELECEILMGPTTPFVNQRISVQDNLIMNELYFVGENSYVPVFPYIKMGPQPNDIEDTCYFYSSKDNKGARFVSYNKSIKNEYNETSDYLLKTLDEIQTLKITPMENLFAQKNSFEED